MITYTDSLESVTAADLDGLLVHWDFTPPPGTLLAMLHGSTHVILARDEPSSAICGYIAALSDGIACAYISAIEVRPGYCKQGIGTELLKRMKASLVVYGTYLSCAPAMVPFYQSAGFSQVTGMGKRRIPAPD